MRAVQAALAAACREACQAGAGAPTLRAGGAGSGCGAGGKVRPWLGRAQHLAPLATDRTLATAPDPAPPPLRAPAPDPDAFPPARVRTFALIAHVDHGKRRGLVAGVGRRARVAGGGGSGSPCRP